VKEKSSDVVFQGVYAATLTPMHNDFSCNYKELANHCKDLMSRGCSGVVLFGSTGEGPSFSVEERILTLKNLIDLGLDPKRLIMGISCCSFKDAVALTFTATKLNCAAVMIVPPFFYKNTDEKGVITFYKEIIQQVENPNLKIFLYHIPQFSGVPITINMISALRQKFPHQVIGIKESEGNMSFTKEILAKFPDFKVFVGKETHISEAIKSGAAGSITGLCNAFPELTCSLFEYGRNQQKPNYNEIVNNIVKILSDHPIFPAIKKLVEMQKGSAWQTMRPPLIPLSEKQNKLLIDSLDQIQI
jgi:4-hydroxy-tetrahydrodipicolinate synthase